MRLWMRHEVRATERRAPIAPRDARTLVEHGIELTVEESPQRCFATAGFLAAGCAVAPAGSWVHAPSDAYVVGLKELSPLPPDLIHRHVFFGHAYKGQPGSLELLRRFASGGGALLDLEYLVDARGRRLAAFGYWAGYVGAALAVLHARRGLTPALHPTSKRALDAELERSRDAGDVPRVLVIGALGRSGRGACSALATAGIVPTRWDVAETRALDRAALLAHDVLVNTVLTRTPTTPFLTSADLAEEGRRLRVVADVTCDVGSDCNVLPIYDRVGDWSRPVQRLRDGAAPLDLIAIDNLPSLVPEEASLDFSAQLVLQIPGLEPATAPWQRCLWAFDVACADLRPAIGAAHG